MKRREKLFLGNIQKILDLEIFGPSHSSSYRRGYCLPTDSALLGLNERGGGGGREGQTFILFNGGGSNFDYVIWGGGVGS